MILVYYTYMICFILLMYMYVCVYIFVMFMLIYTMLRPFPCSSAGSPRCYFLGNCGNWKAGGASSSAPDQAMIFSRNNWTENCCNFKSSCFLSPNSALLSSVGRAGTAEKENPRVRKDGKIRALGYFTDFLSPALQILLCWGSYFHCFAKSLF